MLHNVQHDKRGDSALGIEADTGPRLMPVRVWA